MKQKIEISKQFFYFFLFRNWKIVRSSVIFEFWPRGNISAVERIRCGGRNAYPGMNWTRNESLKCVPWPRTEWGFPVIPGNIGPNVFTSKFSQSWPWSRATMILLVLTYLCPVAILISSSPALAPSVSSSYFNVNNGAPSTLGWASILGLTAVMPVGFAAGPRWEN